VRTNVPGAQLLERLAILRYSSRRSSVPSRGSCWRHLRIGLANVGLRSLHLAEPLNIYTRLGIIWVMGIYMAPYVLMIVASALRSMDPSLEEAGQVSGLNRWRVAMRITLPVVDAGHPVGRGADIRRRDRAVGTPVLLAGRDRS